MPNETWVATVCQAAADAGSSSRTGQGSFGASPGAAQVELLALIAKRDNADAWTLCMSSLHVDFHTAHEIVAMLAGDQPD